MNGGAALLAVLLIAGIITFFAVVWLRVDKPKRPGGAMGPVQTQPPNTSGAASGADIS